jgi:hypothetical protein
LPIAVETASRPIASLIYFEQAALNFTMQYYYLDFGVTILSSNYFDRVVAANSSNCDYSFDFTFV